jgi:hypothetical protein
MQAIRDTHHSAFLQEAARLATDGEIGNSDAIRLLGHPHGPDDLRLVLDRFGALMTPQAKSKLTLAAWVPLRPQVQNQRFEPIFDRYPLSGRTYTTAGGTTVLEEVQYYNGRMVQLFGGCANVAAVGEALAGSGHVPVTLRHPDGRQTAIAQLWAHTLTDTSLHPYDAMFIVVAAVPESMGPSQRTLRAHENGASSLLSMLYGTYTAPTGTYTNHARLFFIRLLDSTRVAIEVGRERMGTDKRPGTVDVVDTAGSVSFAVRNGAGHAVVTVKAELDAPGCLDDVATAAAAAGIPLAALPPGTEYVYPGVARIARDPIVSWEWRSDLRAVPRHVPAGAVTFSSQSEEGALIAAWGFRPEIMIYIPNVRGVVTGIPDRRPSRGESRSGVSRGQVELIPR